MNSGCILLQCTDTGSCAYEHQIKGSGAPGNPTAMNGNVPVQWCDIPAWELAWSTKRELTAGHPIVQVGVDSSERAEWVLRGGKQDLGLGTEPVMARRSLVTSAGKGNQGKGALKNCSTKSNIQAWHPCLLLLLLPGCGICPELTSALQWLQGRQGTATPHSKLGADQHICTCITALASWGSVWCHIGLHPMIFFSHKD